MVFSDKMVILAPDGSMLAVERASLPAESRFSGRLRTDTDSPSLRAALKRISSGWRISYNEDLRTFLVSRNGGTGCFEYNSPAAALACYRYNSQRIAAFSREIVPIRDAEGEPV